VRRERLEDGGAQGGNLLRARQQANGDLREDVAGLEARLDQTEARAAGLDLHTSSGATSSGTGSEANAHGPAARGSVTDS
jgi:hypothetical protein